MEKTDHPFWAYSSLVLLRNSVSFAGSSSFKKIVNVFCVEANSERAARLSGRRGAALGRGVAVVTDGKRNRQAVKKVNMYFILPPTNT